MRVIVWLLALTVGLGTVACKSPSWVPLDELTDEEKDQLSSSPGLPVAGYISDRGTRFTDKAYVRRGVGGKIEFTPVAPGTLFPGTVAIPRWKVQAIGRPRTNVGKSAAAFVLIPLLLIPALVAGGELYENYTNMVTMGGLE